MAKSPWEARVGKLLILPGFVYSFKPVDSGFYGGQPRIDWHACDKLGAYWLIEVKLAQESARTFNLLREVTPGQIDALDAVSGSGGGIAMLAIGQNDALYVWDWEYIRWLVQPGPPDPVDPTRFPFATGKYLLWTGPKSWVRHDLFDVGRALHDSVPAPTQPFAASAKLALSRSTLKPEGSTPTNRKKRRLELLSSMPTGYRSS